MVNMKKIFIILFFIFVIFIYNNCGNKKNLLTIPEVDVTPTATNIPPEITPSMTQVLYFKNYGGNNMDLAYSAVCTGDGYLIVGRSDSFSNGNRDIYLVKTDLYGNLLWQKIYGGVFHDEANSIRPTTDGNFIICGYTNIYGNYESDLYYLKIDPSGNVIWEKTFGAQSSDEYGYCAIPAIDGGYIITGIDSYSSSFLLKTDSDGNCVWTKSYQYDFFSEYNSIVADSNSYYILTDSASLLKIDLNGNILWKMNYNYSSWAFTGALIKTSYNNFIAVLAGSSDVTIFKIDNNGNCLTTKTWNDFYNFRTISIAETLTHDFIMNGTLDGKIALLKFDIDLNEIWLKTYTGNSVISDSESRFCLISPSGNYIVGGSTCSAGINGDYFLMETDTEGNKIW